MNNKPIKLVALGVGAYALFASTVLYVYKDDPEMMDWDDRETFNRGYIAKIDIDNELTRNAIIEKLGAPDISEAKQIGEDNIQILFYRTQHMAADGKTTKDECTPLLFKNGTLIAYGETAYSEYQAVAINLN